MPRTKKCVKDLDTDKCRKAIKSGRPRCSGKRADCVSDDSGKYCRKSRKPGRPRISKRMYKKPSGTVKPRKKRSDCGKRRKKRSDAGKRRPKKSCTPRKRRSDCGKPRKERSSYKDASIMSMDDYRNFIKVSQNVGSLKNLLDFAGSDPSEYGEEYIVNAANNVINNNRPMPSAPPPPPSSDNTDAMTMAEDNIQAVLEKAVTPQEMQEGVAGQRVKRGVLALGVNNNDFSSLFNANDPVELRRVEAVGESAIDDAGSYGPVSFEKGEYGAWRESHGAKEWISEDSLPSNMKEDLELTKKKYVIRKESSIT